MAPIPGPSPSSLVLGFIDADTCESVLDFFYLKMRTLITAVLALSIGVFAAPGKPSGYGSAPIATVKNGTLVGRYSPEYDQDFFLGVPFAQPPVGDLRFRQAVPLNTSWNKARDASQYQAECVGYGVR
jgi:hypothetical protein